MRLILTNDVAGLGVKGDIVNVATGYGRNYLLPKNLAVNATRGAINQIQEARRVKAAARQRELEAAYQLRQQIFETRIVIAAQVTEEGRLFGSIGRSEVIDAVRSLSGITLDRKTITQTNPIKNIGLHEVKITLDSEVEFPLTIDVIPA